MFVSYVIFLGISSLCYGYKVDFQNTNVSESFLPPESAVPQAPIVQSTYYKTKEEKYSKTSSNDVAQRLSRAHFEFTLKLHRALVTVGDPSQNMVFSPLLVSTLLTPLLLSARDFADVLLPNHMASAKDKYAGGTTRNQTTAPVHRYDVLTSLVYHININIRVQRAYSISKQIQQALSFNNLTLQSIEAWHKATVATLQDRYYKKLLGAPRGILLLRKNHDKRLQKILQKWFDSTLIKTELPTNASKIAEEINSWAKLNTKNQIEILVNESLLRRKLTLLLSPASLDSIWLNPFDENRTYMKGLFYLSSKERFEIPMMTSRHEIPLGYSPLMEARVIELPFQSRRASLFIILPDDLDQPLNVLEANLTSENVRSLLSTLKNEVVNLRVPRFFVDSSPQIVEALKLLGVEDLFTETKGSKDSRHHDSGSYQTASDLYIHDFVHRVKFKMDEGIPNTESFQNVSSSQSPYEEERVSAFGVKYFELDHPFVFFLWDYIASTIILMGRVVNPQPII